MKFDLHDRSVRLALLGGLAALCIGAAAALLVNPSPAPSPPQYLLKDHGGRLALYTGEGAEIYTRLLPERDLLALQQGVPVADESELQRRLEDYGL